jgi:hypothetical protein
MPATPTLTGVSLPVPLSLDEMCALRKKGEPAYIGYDDELFSEFSNRKFISWIINRGNEFFENADSVTAEESFGSGENYFVYPNLITRSGNVLRFNADAKTEMTTKMGDDYCAPNPEKMKFNVAPDTMVWVSDGTSLDMGIVSEVANDGSTVTLQVTSGAAWTVGTSNLSVNFGGRLVDWEDCGITSCYNNEPIQRLNHFNRQILKCQFQERELLGGNVHSQASGKWLYSQRLDNERKYHIRNVDRDLFFGSKFSADSSLGGLGVGGMKSILDQLKLHALKISGIDDKDDLNDIINYFRKYYVPPKNVIMANPQVYTNLQDLVTDGVHLTYAPFGGEKEAMARYDFQGISLQGYEFYFSLCDILSTGAFSEGGFATTMPKFVIIPDGKFQVKAMNKTRNVGYINIIWGQAGDKTYKFFRRQSTPNNCPWFDVSYESYYSNLVLRPYQFVLGI